MMKSININFVAGILGVLTYYGVFIFADLIYSNGRDFEMSLPNIYILVPVILATILFELWDKGNRYRALNSIVYLLVYLIIFLSKLSGILGFSTSNKYTSAFWLDTISNDILMILMLITIILLVYVQMNFISRSGHTRTKMTELGTLGTTRTMLSTRGTERNALKHMVDKSERNAKLFEKE